MQNIYDLAILGGGPAGAAAAVYAARKRLKSVLITRDWLGQSNVSDKIENWVGTVAISGLELSMSLEKHAKAYAAGIIDFKENEGVTKIEKVAGTRPIFTITTDKGSYQAYSVLIATGSRRRKLPVPGADTYEHKGVTYCATCDGPLYNGQDVIVVGGGNAAFESAAQLMAYCKSVTLVNRSGEFKSDPGTVEAVSKNPNVKVLTFAVPKSVAGDKFVTSFTYTDAKTGTDVTLPTTGVFVEIGSIPNTDFAKNILTLDAYGHVPVDAKNQRTAVSGVWSAGDCTDGLYHQNNIAAGDAVKAIEDIYSYLKTK